jgi:hypothetical protein
VNVERDRTLIGVEVQESTGSFPVGDVVLERSDIAGVITSPGLLDLDDVRAKIGEQLAAIRSGDKVAQLHHLEFESVHRSSHRALETSCTMTFAWV